MKEAPLVNKDKREKTAMKASREIWVKKVIGAYPVLLVSLENPALRALKEVRALVEKQVPLDHQGTKEKSAHQVFLAILEVLGRKETKDR